MSRTLRIFLVAFGAAAAAGAAWLAWPAATTFSGDEPFDPGDATLAARGEYLAVAGNCATCHTSPGGAHLAGGLPLRTPFGTIHSTNITPDEETGIGSWTFADFANSMRHGVRPDGTHLYPAFPYTAFTKIRDEDLAAIFAWLRTVPAVRQTARANELAFPFDVRALVKAWKGLFLETGAFTPVPERSDEWNRGAYLVEALGHCAECHSPRNALGAMRGGLAMGGGRYLGEVQGGATKPWFAPDLTSSGTGLGLWPDDDLFAYLKTGRNSFLETFGPMNEVVMNSTRHLDERDVRAMAVYLKSLPASAPVDRKPVPAGIMGRGRTVYNLHCGTCHLPTGLGDPEMAPRLDRGSLVVQAADPASMINVVLYAPEDPGLPPQWRKRMEEFQYLLDDEEVAAVTSYIRNSWGNRAGLVTPAEVARQR